MPFHGTIVVIRRSGLDGSTWPLVNEVRNEKLIYASIFQQSRNACLAVMKDAISGSRFPLSAKNMQKYQ